ncbi:MAG: tRNA dihydrouridine synthase DusB [Oscillospiraceae bacterium]|jgi:tRNA-dihydrouridine synthase B|nr:tRNA dihydrouridine synthase DusB [Oscillospiraceae bacterium]
MQFLGREINSPLFLAPMAGVTDYAFRSICAEHGAGVTITEMVSSRALVYQDKKSRALLKKNEGSLCGAQIFGNDPEIMAQAAVLALAHSGCDFIDINMGCPMPKIVNNGDGSALMRNPQLAGQIVRAVSQAVDVPVTVKTRIGWDKSSINIVEFAQVLEENGASAIAVHGRTRTMLYAGRVDWDILKQVARAVTIPLIANGDIFSVQDLLSCRERSGAAYFMLGRGTFGDPWLFSQANAALRGEAIPERPPLAQRIACAVQQFSLAAQDRGEHIACLEARKHFAWYLRGVSHSAFYKEQIAKLSTMEDIYAVAKAITRDLR